jgi:hypothetical protein
MSIYDLPFIGKRLATKEKLKAFEPAQQNDAFNEYSASAGTAGDLKAGVNAMTDYTKARLKSLKGFADLQSNAPSADGKASEKKSPVITTPDGQSLADKLKVITPAKKATEAEKETIAQTNAAREELVTEFNKSLELSDGMKAAQINFEGNLKAVNQLFAKSRAPGAKPLNLAAVAGFLQEMRNETETAIKAQHKLEKDNTLNLFTDPSDSLNEIKLVMGLDTPEDVTQFKDDIIKELEKSQKAELDKFGKTMSDEVIKLHNFAQTERDRVALIDIFYKQSKFNKVRIDAAAAYRQKNNLPEEDTTVEIGINPKEGKATFKGIKPDDLDTIETITGRKMKCDKNAKTWSMDLPKFGFIYYNRSHQQLDYDFTTMAAAVRASGYSGITMSVEYDDEEYAKKLARIQFESAVKAGFDPTAKPDPKDPNKEICDIKIKIIVKGKETFLSQGELFAGEKTRLQAVHNTYAKEKAEREHFVKSPPNLKQEQAKFKNQVVDQRDKSRAAELAAASAAAPSQRPEIRL